MLIKTLRNLLKSDTIAKNYKRWNNETYDWDYVRQILAWHKGDHVRNMIEYEVAWQLLFEIKERHDNYVQENHPLHDVEEEWSIFLENNTQ